jgi:hypothetical protein
MGRRKARVSQALRGEAGTRESEEGHCSAVEVVILNLDLHCCWATYRER